MTETLADLGEFGLIDRIDKLLQREGIQAPGVTLGIGDDAASFRPQAGYEMLVTCDSIVEGRHYLPDYITPMVEWVENGKAPEAIVGINPGITNWFDAIAIRNPEGVDWYGRTMKAGEAKDPATKSTRLLCPYPQVARYKGSGDIKNAANYSCVQK